MTTIIDVAKAANVSKSTVSRVISGNGYVSKESRARILNAMEELAYSPNWVARNLQSGETKTIGFLAQGYIDPIGVFLTSFIDIAKHYNYYVTLFFTDGDKKKEIDALNQLKYKQIDGIFLMTRANDWDVIEPYTMYGPISTWHRIDSDRIYSSYIDHYSGYLHSLTYLYEQGYRKIAHVMSNPKNLNTKARVKAIDTFYQQTGLLLNQDWIFYDVMRETSGRKLAYQWHLMSDKPDAIAFYTDSIAADFISELQDLGYQVPDDVAVIGFDNSYVSKLMHMTTVDYAINHQAENSFIHLYNRLNKQSIAKRALDVQLVERKTTPKVLKSTD